MMATGNPIPTPAGADDAHATASQISQTAMDQSNGQSNGMFGTNNGNGSPLSPVAIDRHEITASIPEESEAEVQQADAQQSGSSASSVSNAGSSAAGVRPPVTTAASSSYPHKPSPLSIPTGPGTPPPGSEPIPRSPNIQPASRSSTMPVQGIESGNMSRKSSMSSRSGHSLIRKLSGINIFGKHHKDKQAAAAAAASSASPVESSGQGAHAGHQQDLKMFKHAQAERQNTMELVHPRTKDVSTPATASTQASPPKAHLSPQSAERTSMFTVGGGAESLASTPGVSRGASRHSSVAEGTPDGTALNSSASSMVHAHVNANGSSHSPRSPARQAQASSPQAGAPSPSIMDALADDPDFMPKPVRSRSTFGFWTRDKSSASNDTGNTGGTGADVRRVASFNHKTNGAPTSPQDVPGRARAETGQSMSDLSRTLSKTSLARGAGWGAITGNLPKFDQFYHYQEADAKLLKLPKKGAKGQVGEGAGGVVRTARLKSGKRPQYHPESQGGDLGLFAVKTFAKKREKEDEGFYCAKLVREFRVHCALSHANIVKLADICVEDHKFGEQSFVAVMDYCIGGDLFDLHYHAYNAIDQGVMGKAEKNCCYKQLMFAVHYMHQQGIAHRDIKLENMLMNGHGQLKLADFGTSLFVSGPDAEECRGVVGTDHSIPPEAYLSGNKDGPAYDGLKADIWACACVFHFLTWENDSPVAALNAYPFGGEGADPTPANKNKAWSKYINNLKRYEPNKFLPGYEGGGIGSPSGSVPGTPISRQNSMAPSVHSSDGGYPSGSYVSKHTIDSTLDGTATACMPDDDNRDPLRKKAPFCRLPASSFTSMKGMLDPNPDTRWTAAQVLQDKFFDLIDCCQQDSNPEGYKPSAARQKKKQGQANKVHNHIRPTARKLMESNSVEQGRHQDQVDTMRNKAA